MKETKNESILITLNELNIANIKDEELNKIAQKVANTININGLRRHINSTLMAVVENKSKDNNAKIELTKTILSNQKLIEKNVRNLKRKKAIAPTDKNEILTFIKTTAETLAVIKQYQPLKEEKKAETTTSKAVEPKAQPTAKQLETKAGATHKAVATKKNK